LLVVVLENYNNGVRLSALPVRKGCTTRFLPAAARAYACPSAHAPARATVAAVCVV